MPRAIEKAQTDLRQLASAMNQISQQVKGPHPEEKVYVTFNEHSQYVTVIGIQGKKKKEMKAEQLVKIVEQVVNAAYANNVFIPISLKEEGASASLDHIAEGLEVLRRRIEIHRDSRSPILKAILNFFGIKDKSDKVIEQINKTINIVNQYRLNLQIELLKIEIKIADNELKKLCKKQYNMPELAMRKQNYEQKLKEYEKNLREINNKKEKSLNGYREASEKLKSKAYQTLKQRPNDKLDLDVLVLEKQKELKHFQEIQKKAEDEIAGMTKAGKPSLFFKGKKSAGSRNLKEAKQELSKAKKNVEFAQRELSKIIEINNDLSKLRTKYDQANQLLIKEAETIQQKKSHVMSKLDNAQREINDINNKILIKEKYLKEKEEELIQKGQQLAEITLVIPPSAPKLKQKTVVNSPLCDRFPTASPQEKALLLDIESRLGFTDNQQVHTEYQRQLIFGFSVGQRRTLEEIAKLNQSLTLNELEKMLEGGTGLTNMFYLHHYLENLIPKAEAEDKELAYIQNLKALRADLQRSLPLALRGRAIELQYQGTPNHLEAIQKLKRLEKDIQAELRKMGTDARIFLPIGTTEHETLLCLQKTSDNEVIAITYNTGDGVEENLTTGFKAKAITDFLNACKGKAPTKMFYSPADFNNEAFGGMLRGVLQNRLVRGTMSDINKILTSQLKKGQSGPTKELQLNGVCSFQVFNEAFEDIMGNHLYSQFHYDLLNDVQENFEILTHQLRIEKNNLVTSLALKLHEVLLKDNEAEIGVAKRRLLKR